MVKHIALAFLVASLWTAAQAFEIEQPMADPEFEARAAAINSDLRCLVCQNQSIAESNAGLAKDLRRLVRERIAAGDTDEEVIRFMVTRYGDFVLLNPPVKPTTYALWFAPPIILLLGAGIVYVYLRRSRRTPAGAPLSEAERQRLKALLGDPESE
jgi:cytochrome c-type biogenesis protein CcmH